MTVAEGSLSSRDHVLAHLRRAIHTNTGDMRFANKVLTVAAFELLAKLAAPLSQLSQRLHIVSPKGLLGICYSPASLGCAVKLKRGTVEANSC